jgi:hypothetical protein
MKGSDRGMNLIGVHCIHVYISQWNTFVQLIYANKNVKESLYKENGVMVDYRFSGVGVGAQI